MKYNKHIILLLVTFVLGLSSCKDWEDLNTDPKNPTETDAGTLVAYAQKYIAHQYNRINVNDQPGLLLSQYWAQGPYPQISRYQFEGRNLSDNLWSFIYIRLLNNLTSAREFLAAQSAAEDKKVTKNREAIITVLEVFTWQWLVDTYGNVPYFDALSGRDKATPKYDDAKVIYLDILDRLNTAIDKFDESATGFGSQDILYTDNITNWKKFANSLKLRIAIRLIDSEEALAKEAIEAAADKAFTSNSEHALLDFLPGSVNGHPHYEIVLSGRDDYAVSKTLVDVMNDLEDPRRPLYMTAIDGKYVGLEYGLSSATSDLTGFSHATPELMDATSKGELLSYAEVQFILAEAAELHGVSTPKSAEDHYNDAITASILQYGGTQDDANTYLSNSKVDFSTAEGGDKKKAIAIQKWISLYKNGFEGWNEWKRLDYPELVVPEIATSVPVRIKYPVNEQTLNGTNVAAAAKDIGGDKYDTKLFWDKN